MIESHDPFEGGASTEFFDLAQSLARRGNDVVVLFAGDGVRAALAGQHSFWLAELRRAGVTIVAERRALAARGLTARELAPGVIATPNGTDDVLLGRKPLWIADSAIRRAA